MKEFIKRVISQIPVLWEKLPAEVKVGVYYAGAIALNGIADALLGDGGLDFRTILKVFVANVILVFVKQAKPRLESLRE